MRSNAAVLLLALLLAGCGNNGQPRGALQVTTSTLPAARVGASYSQQLIATGGVAPYSWSVASGALPAGVTLSVTGVLTGIPQASGSFSFTVAVMDSGALARNKSYLKINWSAS